MKKLLCSKVLDVCSSDRFDISRTKPAEEMNSSNGQNVFFLSKVLSFGDTLSELFVRTAHLLFARYNGEVSEACSRWA